MKSSPYAVALVAALLLAVLPLPSAASHRGTPAPTATPALPPEDPAITRIARQQFVSWQIGEPKRAVYTAELNAMVTADQIKQTTQALSQLGGLLQAVWEGNAVADDVPTGSKTYLYRMVCTDGSVYMEFSIEPSGKIAGILFRNNITDF